MKYAIIFAALVVAVASNALPRRSELCDDGSVGSIVDTDCTKFYVCSGGFLFEQFCPGGTYFNGRICDFAANVVDCDANGMRRDPAEQPEEPAPEENEPQEPAPEEPAPQEPAPEEPAPQEPAPEEPIITDCPNKPYFYLRNPSNPNTFFICQKGVQNGSGKCGEGLVFRQDKQYCVEIIH